MKATQYTGKADKLDIEYDKERISYANLAKLSAISYLENKDAAVSAFKKLGFDVSYFTISKPVLGEYPELYILSSGSKPELIIVFKGSDSNFDWFQNAKFFRYWDVPIDNTVFIPKGHAGFRRGVMNLINYGLDKYGIEKHLETFNLPKTVELTLVGHSQGGALSQLATPYLDGIRYLNSMPTKLPGWGYKVKRVITFGTPLALEIDKDSWSFMNDNYGDITSHVIRDGDVVSTMYIPSDNLKLYRLYGTLIRIDRDGRVHVEKSKWGADDPNSLTPHGIKSLESTLRASGY